MPRICIVAKFRGESGRFRCAKLDGNIGVIVKALAREKLVRCQTGTWSLGGGNASLRGPSGLKVVFFYFSFRMFNLLGTRV